LHTENQWVRALPWALLALALGLPLVLALSRGHEAKELDDLGAVPSFRLTERSGRTVSRDDLLGAPWVASFVYTRCEGPCPMLTGRMASLAERAAKRDVRLVSISVDPEHDTPEALRAYAERYDAPPDRWLFLTGETEEIRRLVRDGFHLALAEASDGAGAHGGPLTHSTRVVLVDGDGRIRRYYLDGADPWVDEVLADLEALPAPRGRG
jgi:cytochrome oxidase Cu insertion factor (SCO1/SenC/PrrC family)